MPDEHNTIEDLHALLIETYQWVPQAFLDPERHIADWMNDHPEATRQEAIDDLCAFLRSLVRM